MSRLALLPAALAVACGGASRPGDARPPVDSWLVWSSTNDRFTTQWVDATGRVRAEVEGVIVAHGDQLYRLQSEQVPVATTSCDAQNGEPVADDTGAENGSATRVVLAPLTGADEIAVVTPAPPAADDEMVEAEHTHAVTIEAGLGPFLFLTESTYSYSCGAHGNTGVSAAVFDVSRGDNVVLADDASVASLRDQARAALVAASDGNDLADPADPATEIHLATSVPVWKDGGVRMRHRFWIDACYACSDGAWSSYTRTATVEDATLPLAIGVLPPVPQPVAAWLSSQPDPRGVSWGRATEAWAKVLPAKPATR